MPDTMSEERRSLLAAYGARLILTPDTKGMGGAIHKAEELVQENSDYFMPQQFNNPANPESHRRTTAMELLKQFKRIDAFVAGVGTGGTITGVGEVLKDRFKGVKVCAVEPASSPVISGGRAGLSQNSGNRRRFIPAVLNRQVLDEIIRSAIRTRSILHAVWRQKKVFSWAFRSGAACSAALQRRQDIGKRAVVVTVFADKGEHYLSTDLFGEKRWTQN